MEGYDDTFGCTPEPVILCITGMVREGPRKWPPLGFDSLDHQREVTFCSCSVSLKGKSSPTSPYTPHIKMTNGHKRGRVNPAASLELRRERNRRYYVKHKAAKKPSSTNVAEPTEAVASTFAANPLQMDATILEIPQGQSASKPHIKMPSGHNTGCADPSASLERRNASLERRRERNRRYYVKHKAAKKPSSTNVAESTEAVASTFAANPSQMDATIPEIPQGYYLHSMVYSPAVYLFVLTLRSRTISIYTTHQNA
ncbi:hypothetical protein L1987_32132 [Smallanthus sonchifolius]|uniref:Uncharacterized protein n=1 Tax=Smallanthus sonchifolius TaxID=185202 RepID=A0ACB9I906_9ASTR|nr:hypothetical protein L1987_32132 [Smallanthus sonchifolius]